MSAQLAQTPIPHIPHARAGRITDQVLDHIIAAAKTAQTAQTLTEADAALILVTLPQIAEELRQRRAAMDLISDVTDLDNVLFMPSPAKG
ncbi:MAG: hypothetical protein KBT70_18550 [Roseovarius sp.]|uniref:hypothetical protein n=1 Tax=Roseovarius sp. TaxID=1486281 RepID=UPI001B68C2F4|nr:hypothetical protein [Roseovarius sp.]MBQ0752199.1 hypothetical protein [Roseovarius sp.]MBQ0812093.1 hypothetical protein [Roseovarius sp.]